MIVTNFPRKVRVIEHMPIPLKDGTTLAARVWLPAPVLRSANHRELYEYSQLYPGRKC